MKGFYIEVTNNLLDKKHVKNMGSAVWEYMWLLDKMTSVSEQGIGKVLGGKPIKREEIRDDIGKALKNISVNLQKLVDGGYINMKRTSFGNIITVNKAKKRYNQKVTSGSNDNVTSQNNEDTKTLHQTTRKRNIMKLRKGAEHSRQDSIDKTVRQDIVAKATATPDLRNKEVQEIIDALTASLDGTPIDGTQKDNRRYAYLLLGKVKKLCTNQGHDPTKAVPLIKSIIKAAHSGWHSKNATSVQYIYRNMGKIIQENKTKSLTVLSV